MNLSTIKTNDCIIKICLLHLTVAIIFVCHGQFVIAACDIEVKNALSVSDRIADEWPLRPSQDNETQHIRKIVDYLVPVIKLHMGSRNFNWPLVGKWEFLLIRDSSVNAYSIGNGKVYITDGTYDFVETEAEMAAILAHEMAHQLMGHFCQYEKNHTRLDVGSLVQVIDNAKEIEADSLAVEILEHTDFPAQSMLTVVQKLPVLENDYAQRELRINALEKKLKEIEIIPYASSTEFLRIKEDAKSNHPMFE